MEDAGDQAPVVAWMERHQVVLYLGALVAGAVLGLAAPAARSLLEVAIAPVLVTLLYATFLGVPFHRLRAAFADARFMTALLVVNFLVVLHPRDHRGLLTSVLHDGTVSRPDGTVTR